MKVAMEAVYKTIVRPVLQEVIDSGGSGLTSVPDHTECIENSHKLGKGFVKNGKTLPPCLIVRFMKREIRDIVICHRKFVPPPSEQQVSAGVTKYRVVEDLTHTNYARLKELIEDDRVEKVWTIQGQFRLVLKSDPKKVS